MPTAVDQLRAGWREHSSGNPRGCETPRAWLAVGRLRIASRCAPAGDPLVGKVLAAIVGQVAGAGCVLGATRGSGRGRPGRWEYRPDSDKCTGLASPYIIRSRCYWYSNGDSRGHDPSSPLHRLRLLVLLEAAVDPGGHSGHVPIPPPIPFNPSYWARNRQPPPPPHSHPSYWARCKHHPPHPTPSHTHHPCPPPP